MRTCQFMTLAVIFLAACTPIEKDDTGSLFIRGTARVVSVDQTLGRDELDYQNRHVEAYWQTEIQYAQGGAVTRADSPIKPPVGVYREPNVKVQTFDAKPGDIIQFVGMRTGRSIFLQGVAVVSQ